MCIRDRQSSAHSAAAGRNQTSATNRALSRRVDGVRDTDRLASCSVRNQASKFFSTEKQGGPRRATEKDSIALRAQVDRAPREAPRWSSPWLSLFLRVEKLTCLIACHTQDPLSTYLDRLPQRGVHLAGHPLWERSWRKRPQISVLSASQRKFVAGRGDLGDQ